MFLKNKLIFIFFFSLNVHANLPELLTKQDVINIRFLSDDGNITYFQKNSGSLLLTHFFQTYEILKSEPFSQFQVIVSNAKKKVLVEVFEKPHTGHRLLEYHSFFLGNYGDKTLTKIGSGIDGRLHLNDSYMSFFDPIKKEIIISKIDQKQEKLLNPINVKLKHKINPYFIPMITLINETTAVLTEMTEAGNQVLYTFDLLTGNFNQVYKTEHAGSKIEICNNKKLLFIGEFSLGDLNNGSRIYTINLKNSITNKNLDLIYSSKLNDIGNIDCIENEKDNEDELYFIQAQSKENAINIKTTEVASLKVNTKIVKVLTNFGDATHIIHIDHRVLVPYRGKFYVIQGENNLKKEDLLKKGELSP